MLDPKKVIEYALSQIGTAEDPLGSNRQPYGAMLDQVPWYLYKEGDRIWIHHVNGEDWCTELVDASFITTYTIDTARKMLFRPQYNNYGAVVKYAFNYFKNAGRGYKKEEYDPKPGDVIYFQNSAGLSHTGIVVEVSDSLVTTVEGNSGKNCWYVAKHTYKKTDSYIYGYGHPDYDKPDPDPKELDGFKVGNSYEVVCNEALMIRKGPGTSYDTVGELNKGDVVTCIGLRRDDNQNTWIQFDRGWCCGLYQGTRYLADVVTGWVKKDGRWYYYDDKGQMVKSKWIFYKNEWYYLGPKGAMLTGWRRINYKRYYLYEPEGHMAHEEWIDDLWLEKNGSQVYPYKGSWRENDKGRWYEDENGWYPKDCVMKINKKKYKFDKRGYVIE